MARNNKTGLILAIALALSASVPGMATAQSNIPAYAHHFVKMCSAALLGQGAHAEHVSQAGFKGRRVALSPRMAWVWAPKNEKALCKLTFNTRSFPNANILFGAITAELSKNGFRDTGQVIATANGGSAFGGTGAKNRYVFTKANQTITLEFAGSGGRVSPVFGLQRLSN